MGDSQEKLPIKGFRDLEVYQNSYRAMLSVIQRVLPRLPQAERFDLRDQLNRSCKAIPRLIAEGYAKRHQRSGFQKYLDDAMAECNETMVSLEQCRDIYRIDPATCDVLIDVYDKTARQLYNLAAAWSRSKDVRRNPYTKRASTPYDDHDDLSSSGQPMGGQ